MKGYKVMVVVLIFQILVSVIGSGATAYVEHTNEMETEEGYERVYVPWEVNSFDEMEELTRIEPLEIELDISVEGKPQSSSTFSSFHLPTIRQRLIEPHPAFYTPSSIPENTTITLNLFDDTTFTTNIHTRTEHIKNMTSITGDIMDFEHGYTVITMGFDKIYGIIEIPENFQRFIIQYDTSSDLHFVYEVDIYNIDDVQYAEPLIPDDEEYEAGLLTNDLTFDPDPWEEVTIKVAVYYTPAANDEADGNILSKIANEIAISNDVLDKSQTGLTLELADVRMVEYTESGDLSDDLDHLVNSGSGEMDEVHDLRNWYVADLVALIVKEGGDDIAGIAWTLRRVSDGVGMPNFAFSVTLLNQLSGDYTFIHEIGHNLGCHHHPDDSSPGPTDWDDWEQHFGEDNDWSAGHRWWRWFQGHRTVMSYNRFGYSRIPRFSNPDASYEGYSTGTSTRNNARTIRTTKHIVSSYRNNVTLLPIPDEYHGSVTTNPNPLYQDGDQLVFGREDVTFTASPEDGYVFSHWSGDVHGSNNPLTLLVDGDMLVKAHFEELHPPVLEGIYYSTYLPKLCSLTHRLVIFY